MKKIEKLEKNYIYEVNTQFGKMTHKYVCFIEYYPHEVGDKLNEIIEVLNKLNKDSK